MRSMKRAIAASIAIAVAAAVFAAGVMWGTRPITPAEPTAGARTRETDVLRFSAGAPQLAALQTDEAPEMSLPLAEPLNARIVYHENHTARIASPISGRLVALHAEPGDRVRAGQALAIVDAPDLGAASADVAKAKADERRKEQAYRRSQELYAGEVLPRRDLESAEADLELARAETRRALLRLENLNPRHAPLRGERLLLVSPLPGVVVERRANPDMQVRPDLPDPLFVITDPAWLQAQIDLPEQHLAKVTVGQPVAVEVDAYPGRRFLGRIERVAPAVDPATRRVQVRASVENVDSRLRPEMYARATLLGDLGRSAIRVPNSALLTLGVRHVVFVEREPGVFVRREVKLAIQDREYSYLEQGLAKGERVVTSGALLLQSELAVTR